MGEPLVVELAELDQLGDDRLGQVLVAAALTEPGVQLHRGPLTAPQGAERLAQRRLLCLIVGRHRPSGPRR